MILASAYKPAPVSVCAPVPSPAGFTLYVHWPFCLAKCPYCDFNSHVRDRVDQGRWRRALPGELERLAAETAGRQLEPIFFGGGTPSLMAPETAAEVIAAARRHWPGPTSRSRSRPTRPRSRPAAAGFRDAGVNRVSLGVQALDDASLAFLGREHSAGRPWRRSSWRPACSSAGRSTYLRAA